MKFSENTKFGVKFKNINISPDEDLAEKTALNFAINYKKYSKNYTNIL